MDDNSHPSKREGRIPRTPRLQAAEIGLTLWRPEYTWAKLPFPISLSMTKFPMTSSLVGFVRFDDDVKARSAMAPCESWR
jgi:hypothetical protein